MSRALLILAAQEMAVFSERAATEGEHRTLSHPTGAALLGWAARAYERFDEADRYTIFHSGAVRFSNALPLTEKGAVAYPAPQLMAEPKHGTGDTRVGRLRGDKTQYEPVSRTLFTTGAGEELAPELGSRLRTATDRGRAATGQLFGYQHISPRRAPRYAATLEADGLCDKAWKRLVEQFAGRTLHLGRASNTSYGGDYRCELGEETRAADIWPRGVAPQGATRVRVWALSDLALVDRHGAPCFAPSAEMLGLPAHGRLDVADSAIGVRRYAPWNRKLDRRDLERQVIAAGSVMSFLFEALAEACPGPCAVGLWRETGLGRVWVAPPLLAGEPGGPRGRGEAPSVASEREPPDDEPVAKPDHELAAWLERVATPLGVRHER